MRIMIRLLQAFLFSLFSVLASGAMAQASPILIGQSAGVTGGQAGYSADLTLGIRACFEEVNRRGGVHGRPLKLVTLDDQGKRDQVLANTQALVEKHQVFALLGYTSGAGVEATLAYLDRAKVPMVGPATGNMGIRSALHRYLFHVRAGYADEARRLVSHFRNMSLKRFGLVYLQDVGPANARAMHEALSAAGLQAVADVALDRNAADFTVQVQALAGAQPEAVIVISNAKPLVKIVKGLRERGFGGYIATSSFAGMPVVEELGAHARGLVMAQVLPPFWRDTVKLVKDYQQQLEAIAPGTKPNYTSLEGYVSARVLVEGLRRAGPQGDRERLVEALEGIGTLDLGGYEINFSPRNHSGSRFVDTGVVAENGKLRF